MRVNAKEIWCNGNNSTIHQSEMNPDAFRSDMKQLTEKSVIGSKPDILESLLEQVRPINFAELQYPNLSDDERREKKVTRSEMRVLILNEILRMAHSNNWALCKQGGFCYLYNGAYWETLNEDDLKHFLSGCAVKMGVKRTVAEDYKYVRELYEQFLFSAHLQPPEYNNGTVLINLKNGTFRITTQKQELIPFSKNDFLTYQLPFEYDDKAVCPIFMQYLNRVLPDRTAQALLSEYAGYLFIRHGSGLKLEKSLILYGSGRNGKSVYFEILSKLLGNENVSTYTLSELTDKTGYFRAEIANKLLNYASEISREMNTDLFKKLASGETFSARSPYGKPFEVRTYAKFIFNANELPRDVEQTPAFFSRFLIVPFLVVIPESEQDRELHRKITDSELGGIFRWVLDGLKRLLKNRRFTECQAAAEALKQYQTESDSVQMFLDEKGYQRSHSETKLLKELYGEYKSFCYEDGYRACSNRTFAERLRNKQYCCEKRMDGRHIYIKNSNDAPW